MAEAKQRAIQSHCSQKQMVSRLAGHGDLEVRERVTVS